MESAARIPFFDDLAPNVFKFGTIVVVEFQPHSLWYETSYTLTAQALRSGIKTDFHTFQRPPEDVRNALTNLAVDVKDMEKERRFRIMDSYTAQIGLGTPETVEPYGFISQSLKMSDWKSQMFNVFNEPEETRLIHIDENVSVLTSYNSEAEVLDFYRRSYTAARAREFLFVYALLSGVHSPSFYNQFESLADVVLDFQSPEESGKVTHLVRIKIARGSGPYESKWHHLKIFENGEVGLAESPKAKLSEAERKLAAIMFTDMAGYTSLSERNETLALELLEEHRKLLRDLFPKHHGIEVKTMGDSFLVEFPSALEALKCANEIQLSLRELNSARAADEKIVLRIGIHLGDVIHSSNDVYGDAVNVASRIQPLAEPGGVCVTQQVYDNVRNKPEFKFQSIGKRELKHVDKPIEIYSTVFPWQSGGTALDLELDRRRIAVLPFANISQDPNDEYFADGLTEELISEISTISELSVIARTSIMQYKNQSKRITEIGHELNVGTLLEGSVRKAGSRVRITAQLIDVTKDKHLWTERYERNLEDVFAIQSEIAEKVAGSLKLELVDRDKQQTGRRKTVNVEAHELYLKGRFYYHRSSREGYEKAIELFLKAIEKDQNFALAYAGLASSYAFLGFFEMAPFQLAYQKAREYAKKALELDSSVAEGHLAFAQVLEYDWDFRGGEIEIRNAIELNPSLAEAHLQLGTVLLFAKREKNEALREIERALELDPLSSGTCATAGTDLLYSGHFDEAIKQLRNALEIDPNGSLARGNLGLAYVQKGMFQEGVGELETAVKAAGHNGRHDLAYAYTKAGKPEEARKILSEMLDEQKKNEGSLSMIAGIYSCLGEKEKALGMLEKAVEEHSPYAMAIGVDFIFDNIRDEPRFQALLSKIGIS